MKQPPSITICPDIQHLTREVVRFWLAQSQQAVSRHGVFNVCLSGGSSPKNVYQALTRLPSNQAIDWQKISFFFGDERVVPQDHPDSNYNMVREAMFNHVPVAGTQIHPIIHSFVNEKDTAIESAQAYSQLLLQQLPLSADHVPLFDLVMLGMGSDGHTASLFPATPILQENSTPVASVYVEKLSTWRVSITFALIEQARQVMIMATGQDKAKTILEVFTTTGINDAMPISRIANNLNVHWFLDHDAASLLPHRK